MFEGCCCLYFFCFVFCLRTFFVFFFFFFFQAEDGIRDRDVTGVQTCALPIAEVQNKVVVPKPIERIPLPKLEAKGKARPLEDHGEIQPAFPFSKAVLLDENRFKSGSRALRLAVSILLHVTVITVPILIGLFFTDTINIKQYAAAMLVAPPPPPPPPATGGMIRAAAARPRFISSGKLLAPTVIPRHIAEIKEAPLEPESDGGVVGGVPGGVPGGQMGGVIGGVLGGVLSTAAKTVAAPPPVKSAPIRD